MRFADMVSDVENQIQNTSIKDQVKRWLNRAQEEIQVVFDWSFLVTEDWLYTTGTYDTGTADVTNASNTISGTGTTWTSAMVGRKIRFSSDSEYYIISAVGGVTAITLDRNYEGTTDTGVSYSIYKDIYRVRGDVNKLKLVRDIGQSRVLQTTSHSDFDKMIPSVCIDSVPRLLVPFGRDSSTYTTGTLSGTAGDVTLTGVGTSWTGVEGLSKGLKMAIGAYTYTIKSVDSDTQITIYEGLETTPAASDYTIYLNNITVQIYPPADDSRGFPYKFFRTLPPLYNDYDESEIPQKYHRVIVAGALKQAFMYQFDERKFALAKAEFNEGLILMQRDYQLSVDTINILHSDDRPTALNTYRLPQNYGTL